MLSFQIIYIFVVSTSVKHILDFSINRYSSLEFHLLRCPVIRESTYTQIISHFNDRNVIFSFYFFLRIYSISPSRSNNLRFGSKYNLPRGGYISLDLKWNSRINCKNRSLHRWQPSQSFEGHKVSAYLREMAAVYLRSDSFALPP